uniref:Transthyretin-like family-containing protein n=1 Tax=Strongyloides stercoralis TaxID=6248 RepID=A0A0K0ERZ1_STRER
MNFKTIILLLFLCILSTLVFSFKKKPSSKPKPTPKPKPIPIYISAYGHITCNGKDMKFITVTLLDVRQRKKTYVMGKKKTRRTGDFFIRGKVKYPPNYEPKLKFTYKCHKKAPKKTYCLKKNDSKFPVVDEIKRKNDTIHIYFFNEIKVDDNFKNGMNKC